jgi:hypothetical protein
MVSNVRAAQIHLRLDEIFTQGSDKAVTFGNKNILLFGDFLQVFYFNTRCA